MSPTLRTYLMNLVPVLASILFGAVCGNLIMASSMTAIPITPFAETTSGSFANAGYFVVLAAVGATILYLLLRRKRHRIIAIVTGFAMTAAAFLLSLVYLSAAFWILDVPYADVLTIAIAFAVTVFVDLAIFRRSRLANLTVLGIGGGLGTFLGFSVPTQSTVLILGFLAVYDAFSVYRGPIGKIANAGLDRFPGLSFSFREIQIGLGDLTFYSMLSGHMLIYYGWLPSAASIMGILVGCLLSFKMLERKGMFPGLPIPILLGLIGGLATSML